MRFYNGPFQTKLKSEILICQNLISTKNPKRNSPGTRAKTTADSDDKKCNLTDDRNYRPIALLPPDSNDQKIKETTREATSAAARVLSSSLVSETARVLAGNKQSSKLEDKSTGPADYKIKFEIRGAVGSEAVNREWLSVATRAALSAETQALGIDRGH